MVWLSELQELLGLKINVWCLYSNYLFTMLYLFILPLLGIEPRTSYMYVVKPCPTELYLLRVIVILCNIQVI